MAVALIPPGAGVWPRGSLLAVSLATRGAHPRRRARRRG